jgi:glucuronosyltransferase
MNFIILAIFSVLTSTSECSKILFMYPTPGISLLLPLHTVSVALAEKGHDVTFVSTFPLGRKVKNYRDIVVPFNEAEKEFLKEVAQNPKDKGFTYVFPRVTSLVYRIGNDTLQDKEVRKLMAEENFDLVIIGYFLNDFMFGMADHFKCPSIIFSPVGSLSIINQALGNPLSVSGTPHLFGPVEQMNFWGRLKTFMISTVDLSLTQYFRYKSKQIYK